MRNVLIVNIEERISHFSSLTYTCDGVINVAKYCGRAVQSAANKLFTNPTTYTQYPQTLFFVKLNQQLCTFYELFNHLVLHTKSMQFTSVNNSLYTVSTGPTITTTLIYK